MIQEKEFFEIGENSGISKIVLRIAFDSPKENTGIYQFIADKKAELSASCQTPKPPPRLDPGYWACVNGDWVWVPAT